MCKGGIKCSRNESQVFLCLSLCNFSVCWTARWASFLRLQEVMDKGCSDKQFVMRSQRLGVNSAMTIARLLDRTPIEKIDLYENVIRDHGVQVPPLTPHAKYG